jgi:hypothetical protein
MAGPAKAERPNRIADHGSRVAPADRATPLPRGSRERSRDGLPGLRGGLDLRVSEPQVAHGAVGADEHGVNVVI